MSSREDLIVGLNLLRLLVYNRISDFHTDLELMESEVSCFKCPSKLFYTTSLYLTGLYKRLIVKFIGLLAIICKLVCAQVKTKITARAQALFRQ